MASNKDKKKKQQEEFNLKAFLAPYIEKWYYFVISIVVFGILGFLYIKSRSSVYQVNANLLISQDDAGGVGGFANFESMFGDSGDVDDEIFILSSHAVYKKVSKDLNLNYEHYVKDGLRKVMVFEGFPVEVYAAPALLDTLSCSMKFNIEVRPNGLADVDVEASGKVEVATVEKKPLPITLDTKYGKFVVNKTKDFPAELDDPLKSIVTICGYDMAAERLNDRIDATLSNKRTHVISLEILTPNTEYGVAVLNAVMDEYNRRGVEDSKVQNEKTAEFIDKRLAMLQGDLDNAEGSIQDYKEGQGVMSIQWDSEYTYKLKGETESALIKARTDAEVLKLAYEFIANPKNAYEVMPSVVHDSNGLESAIKTYNELILRRMEVLANAKDGNVALKQITAQIDAMRESIVNSIEKSYESSVIGVKDLQSQVNTANSTLGRLPQLEKDFNNLYRERGVKLSLYQYLLRQKEETAMLLANAIPKGVIIDEAYVLSEPVGLSPKVKLLAILIAAVGFAAFVIYLQNSLRSKFVSRSELEKVSDVPVLGEIGTTKSPDKLIVGPGSNSSNAELFRLMRANLQFILNDKGDKVVLITSTQSGEGKSFISLNLAASFALMGKKVLLMGMDIRKPRLAQYLGLNVSQGLTNYLSTPGSDISKYIVHDSKLDGLDVLVAGPIPPNPAELLASDKVDKLFATLREMYDYVIVDTAPVGMVADTFTLNRIADATVYVTRVNVTRLADIDFINDIYSQKRLSKLSVVVNGINLKKGSGYGYGYGENHKKAAGKS